VTVPQEGTTPADTDKAGARRFNPLVLMPLALFAVVMAFFAVGLGHDPQLLPSALINKPAPSFNLPALVPDRAGFASTDLGGKPALVNFFASWCAPCRSEAATLAAFAANSGVPVYGIDYKDRPDDARQYLSDLGDPYAKLGADAAGRVFVDFGAYGVPETFIVDAAGRIRFRYPGPLTDDVIANEIMPRLKAIAAGG
jgi:cytochrome c biogenesis protein CcmG/thiol:disulfide interchange protein DsbE